MTHEDAWAVIIATIIVFGAAAIYSAVDAITLSKWGRKAATALAVSIFSIMALAVIAYLGLAIYTVCS